MSKDLATIETTMKSVEFTSDELAFIKDKYASDATDMEWKEFIALCQMHGANPMKKQIYFIKFKGNASIIFDFKFKLQKAMEAGTIKGFTKPTWYDKDGNAKVVWSDDATKEKSAPFFGEIGVYLNGNNFPVPVTLYWSERCKYMNEWLKQPLHMFEKCLISKAADLYAAEVSGMHIAEEMIETPQGQWEHTDGPVSPKISEVAQAANDKQRARSGDLRPSEDIPIDAKDKGKLKLAFGDLGLNGSKECIPWCNEVLKVLDSPTVEKLADLTKGQCKILLDAAVEEIKARIEQELKATSEG